MPRREPRGKGPTDAQLRNADWLRLSDQGWSAAAIAARYRHREAIVAAKLAELKAVRAKKPPEPIRLPDELEIILSHFVPHFPVPAFTRVARVFVPEKQASKPGPRDFIPPLPVTPFARVKPKGAIVEQAMPCPHKGPYPTYSALVCALCHATGRDQLKAPLKPAA